MAIIAIQPPLHLQQNLVISDIERSTAGLRPETASAVIYHATLEFRLIRKAQKAKPAGTAKPIHDTNIGTTYSST
jgi:hypothetical protein